MYIGPFRFYWNNTRGHTFQLGLQVLTKAQFYIFIHLGFRTLGIWKKGKWSGFGVCFRDIKKALKGG